MQFIDDHDHGRQLQSASNHDVEGHAFCPEGHNPTEGGSVNDGAGGSSTSQVLSEEVVGNQLSTSARLAYWQEPGQTNPGGCTAYAQGGPLSNHILQKTVTLGVSTRNAGFVDNLIQFDTTFNVDPDTPYFYHQFRR